MFVSLTKFGYLTKLELSQNNGTFSEQWNFLRTMELSHLDKVTFQSLYRLKVQTYSDNAPTVAPDKVP